MPRRDEPTQAEVLRDRFGRVPWRQAIRGMIGELAGNGRTALPERLEGAVYGQLVGEAVGRGDGAMPATGSAGDGGRMLALLDALLAGGSIATEVAGGSDDVTPSEPDAGDRMDAAGRASPTLALPVAVVLRDRAADDVVGLVSRVSGPASGNEEALVAWALYALVIRRLVAGDRGRADVLRRAARELRATLASGAVPGSADIARPAAAIAALEALLARAERSGQPGASVEVESFRAGWDAFAAATDYADAVTRARTGSPGQSSATALAGGLAGAHWGSSGIPAAWHRTLPDGPRARSLVDRLIETDAPGWDGKPWRTSTSSPLRVDGLDLSGLDRAGKGAVGITFLPGRRYVGYHTGAQWRDLETDAVRMRELGVEVLLLLVEDRELVRCRVSGIGEALAAHGVELVRFPIRDPLLPRDGVAFRRVIVSLLERVRGGASVAIACRGGLDRAGMTAACLLREASLGADEAIDRVQHARRGALTLPDQQAYVRAWPPLR